MCASALVSAEPVIHEESGIEIQFPEGWDYLVQGSSLASTSPDQSVHLLVLLSEQQVVEYFTDAIAQEVSQIIELPEVLVEQGLIEVNELLQFRAEGAGLYQGEIVDWSMAFVAGARKSVIVLAFGQLEEERPVVEEVFDMIVMTEPQPEETVD